MFAIAWQVGKWQRAGSARIRLFRFYLSRLFRARSARASEGRRNAPGSLAFAMFAA